MATGRTVYCRVDILSSSEWVRVEGHMGGLAKHSKQHAHNFRIEWISIKVKSLIYVFSKANDCGFPIHACARKCMLFRQSHPFPPTIHHHAQKWHAIESFFALPFQQKKIQNLIIENGLKWNIAYASFALSPTLFSVCVYVFTLILYSKRLVFALDCSLLLSHKLGKWMQMTKIWHQQQTKEIIQRISA